MMLVPDYVIPSCFGGVHLRSLTSKLPIYPHLCRHTSPSTLCKARSGRPSLLSGTKLTNPFPVGPHAVGRDELSRPGSEAQWGRDLPGLYFTAQRWAGGTLVGSGLRS